MEQTIRAYFSRADHYTDSTARAQCILELFIAEKSELCRPSENGHDLSDLDKALEHFFVLKECRYIKSMLEHFIQEGNFDLPEEKTDTVYRLDRFLNIRELLTEYLCKG